MELGTSMVLSKNLIFELDKFKESRLPAVDEYIANLKIELRSDYKPETTLRMASETFARHAIQAMVGLDPYKKTLFRELAVYVGEELSDHSKDFKRGEIGKRIRKAIREDDGYKKLGK